MVVTESHTKERNYIEFEPCFLNSITHMGRAHRVIVHPSYNKLHTHKNTLEITYISSGDQTVYINKEKFNMKGGDVFFTFPNEIHGNDRDYQERTSYFWIGLDLSGEENFLEYCFGESELLVNALKSINKRAVKGSPLLKKRISDIIDIYLSNDPLKNVKIRNYVTDFILTIFDLVNEDCGKILTSVIRESIEFIEENITGDITIQNLACRSELSESRFKHRFKSETGYPPREYILRRKMDHAKELLRKNTQSITEISYSLGFSSSQYFATVFKKYTGYRPRDFITLESISP